MITENKRVYEIDGRLVVADSIQEAISLFMEYYDNGYEWYEINSVKLVTSYCGGENRYAVISDERPVPDYLYGVENTSNNIICGGLFEDKDEAEKCKAELCATTHNESSHRVRSYRVTWKR